VKANRASRTVEKEKREERNKNGGEREEGKKIDRDFLGPDHNHLGKTKTIPARTQHRTLLDQHDKSAKEKKN